MVDIILLICYKLINRKRLHMKKKFSGLFSTGFVLAESTVIANTGVAKTESHSIAYTVSENSENGKYRLEHAYPSYNLLYGSYTIDGESKQMEYKNNMTKKNEAYRRLTRYAN